MTEPADIVAQAKEAWGRLKSRATFADWLAVGRAIEIGKQAALRAAGTNRPVGSKYNKAMGKWLKDNGLAEVTPAERYRILLILENVGEIEEWRDGLDDAKRRRLNHPGAIWAHWTRATGKAPRRKPAKAKTRESIGKVARNGRPVCFPQDVIRRAALALKESRSTDYFVMAKLVLETAIRTEADVALLIAPPKSGEAARASAAAVFATAQSFPAINLPVATR